MKYLNWKKCALIFLAWSYSYSSNLDEYSCKDIQAVSISSSTLKVQTVLPKFGYQIRNDSMFMLGAGEVYMDKLVPINENKFNVGSKILSRLPGNYFTLVEISSSDVIISKLKCKMVLKW